MQSIDHDDAYRDGHEAGGRLAMAAIDCPYLPPDPRRTAWMAGFGANRSSVSRAADPACFAGAGPTSARDHAAPGMHEG